MKLQILTIADRGIANQERLHIVALADTDLSFYAALLSVQLQTDRVAAGLRTAYWFGPRPVKAGDHIVLYSGPGRDRSEGRPDGRTNHFYHWGFTNTGWGNAAACAVLLEVADWQTSP